MSQIVTGSDIAVAIREAQPTRIAVAYLGADWSDYIPDPGKIEQIIVSPTFGSNPKAILALSEEVSWERLLFLDELHTKIYLGPTSAVVGSANLTANGLCGEALLECSSVLKAREELRRIGLLIDEIARRALTQYPTKEAKRRQVDALQTLWNHAYSRGLIKPKASPTRTIEQFQTASADEIYVLWHMNFHYAYSQELEKVKPLISDDIHFHPDDEPQANHFVLAWRKTAKNTLDKRTKPRWIYIHEIYRDGVVGDDDYEYTTAAIQRIDIAVPPVPFELTDDLVTRFAKVIESGELNSYLVQDESTFRLAATHEAIGPLLSALRGDANKLLVADT